MGLVIHHVLKKLYQPHINKELTIKILDSIKRNIKDCVARSLLKYNIQEVSRGKNLLAIKAIERIVSNFLFQDNIVTFLLQDKFQIDPYYILMKVDNNIYKELILIFLQKELFGMETLNI